MIKPIALAALAVLATAAPAFAHLDPATHGAFAAGFSHPLSGLDHILVMVAVGLWAASVSGRALWTVPLAFLAAMAVGFGAAIAGMPLPFVEPVILASVVFIGIMIALALPIPTAGIAATVAVFALFHGHAHGGELGTAGAFDFAAGFVLATALLHVAGIAVAWSAGRFMTVSNGAVAARATGALTAVAGLWLALGG